MSPVKKSYVTLPDGKVVPVVSAVGKPESTTTKVLRCAARNASANAIKRTHAIGLPATVAKGDKIVKLYPDGREEVIGELYQ